MRISAQKEIYIRLLDRIYCIAAHLAERLDELKDALDFEQLQEEISATIRSLETHLQNLDLLYKAHGVVASFKDHGPLIAFMEDMFSKLPYKDDGTQYNYLLDYLSIANALMAESAEQAGVVTDPDEVALPDVQLYEASTLRSLTRALLQAGQVA
ncbi:hypothetical protein [Mucilaginibacter myungsuensis]|uniref:Ferritin-like metal-binding protein YciE n=1 Tax=Mucilaginibacter myungsuensis TaxID=649104 RepID=A0A929PV24_9SPHI|nr:hypothetical protein [Mucilaginibacter myungsuensis]MBE9661368.1 hypothetical protein [Mucilaginibacter myungsuensis]MDN3597511.1 hypothetical protein [Mucilaginibacter myungsuensis]